MKYVWAERAPIAVRAEVAAEELNRLAGDGEVTASSVVDAARPLDSPLHSAFEWDDAVAAEKHREEQARLMLRSLRIVAEPGAEPRRVFWNIEATQLSGYVTSARVMGDDELRSRLLVDAFRALEGLRKRYLELQELAPVWEAVESLSVTVSE